jgi:cytochrome b561
MYIYRQICYLLHWTTSLVVYLVLWLIALYTTVVRFSYYQSSQRENEYLSRLHLYA